VFAAACSGGKPKAVEDARKTGEGAPRDAAPLAPYRVDADAKVGDVQIRVEWRNVPVVARSSPERTSCGTPRAPSVAPTTTWGIPEVFVSIEVDHGKPLAPGRARVVLDPCALAPRVAVAGTTLALASAADAPAAVELGTHSLLPLGNAAIGGTPTKIYLPVAGHEVEAPLEAGAVYVVAASGTDPAYVVAAKTPYVAITEATGHVVIRDVPIGTHPVRAWLPERGRQPARSAAGTVTVGEGALAEVTVDLTTP
jgi:hypothetical protein